MVECIRSCSVTGLRFLKEVWCMWIVDYLCIPCWQGHSDPFGFLMTDLITTPKLSLRTAPA